MGLELALFALFLYCVVSTLHLLFVQIPATFRAQRVDDEQREFLRQTAHIADREWYLQHRQMEISQREVQLFRERSAFEDEKNQLAQVSSEDPTLATMRAPQGLFQHENE
jgi:hypothetical protein